MENKLGITQKDLDLLNSKYAKITEPYEYRITEPYEYRMTDLIMSSPFFSIPYDELPLYINDYEGYLIAWRLKIGK